MTNARAALAPGAADRPLTQAEIVAGLRQLGLQAGDSVMVHSSLKSFGLVADGPLTVIAALMEVLTNQGTILFPSFNHNAPFDAGGPGYYDPTETPTSNGVIPDAFWRIPGVQRSLDPTHPIAAWGKNSQRYTAFHHRTLTMGPESPLGLLWADDGYGLLLGVGYHSNTFHHMVETAMQAPCLGQRSEAYPVRLPGGRSVLGRTWGWRGGECPINDPAIYAQEMQDCERITLIGNCRATLFRLQDAYRIISRLLNEGKGDLPPCSACPIRPRHTPYTVPSDWDAGKGTLLPDSIAWSY